jgi:uncharacterized damage-inducible protein DinB
MSEMSGCDAGAYMDRGEGRIQNVLTGHVLAHLYMRQTHHRGQSNAMFLVTAIAPPELDEVLMPSDAQFRSADMAALSWDETAVYGR